MNVLLTRQYPYIKCNIQHGHYCILQNPTEPEQWTPLPHARHMLKNESTS